MTTASAVPAVRVPFTGVDREFREYESAYIEITRSVLAHGKVLQGPEVEQLEQQVAARTGRQHCVAVASCTDALAFTLEAQGIGPGDVVLVTGLSFFASVSCILRVGAEPRFVDVVADTAMMDVDKLEALICPRTRAVLAVHLYGQCLPFPELEALAQRHDLLLIEDAAQAIGSSDRGRPAGSLGVASCVSFDPTKVIGCFGSAGAVLCDDAALAETVRRLRYHGKNPATGLFESLGYNSQLPSDHAAQLSFKLGKLDEWSARRTRVADRYLAALGDVEGLTLPRIREGSTHNWHKFVVRTSQRDALRLHLRNAGVATAVHYGQTLQQQPAVQALGLPPAALPVAEKVCRTALSLPIHPQLLPQEIEHVVASVRSFFDVAERAAGV